MQPTLNIEYRCMNKCMFTGKEENNTLEENNFK